MDTRHYTIERTSDFSIIKGRERENILYTVGPMALILIGNAQLPDWTDRVANLVLRDEEYIKKFPEDAKLVRESITRFSVAYEVDNGAVTRTITLHGMTLKPPATYNLSVKSLRKIGFEGCLDDRYMFHFQNNGITTFLNVEY